VALTPKQQAFVAEYLIDLNATQAAIRAGYSAETANEQGSRLLANVSVKAAVESAMEERASRTQITADRVLTELAKLGFSDIRRAVKWHSQVNVAAVDSDADMEALASEGAIRFAVANQVELISSGDIDDDTAAAIAEVSQSSTGALKIKFHDKKGALVDIGRHLGMFNDKLQLSGDLTVLINKPEASASAD
jgi:phage terminase small subunit